MSPDSLVNFIKHFVRNMRKLIPNAESYFQAYSVRLRASCRFGACYVQIVQKDVMLFTFFGFI
jgi:hypothetical protein